MQDHDMYNKIKTVMNRLSQFH